jgi:hypothetical protein
MFPADLFARIQAQVGVHLAARGFACVRTEHAGPFGSRIAEFEGPGSRVSLVWDGKEDWLTLVAHERDRNGADQSHRELYFERFPGLAVERAAYEGAATKLLGALANHLRNVA